MSARPDTFGYRARKFIRRNPSWVAAATIAFAALGATTAVTLVQSRRVAQESERVIRERDKALEVRGFLMEMFGATGADQAIGDSVTARQLLDLQAARIDQAYPDRPELRAEMLEVLADGYDRLGLYRAADPLARTALDLRREILGARHPDVAASLNQVGWLLYETGDAAAAEPILAEAVSIRRAAGPRYALDLSRSLNDHGIVLVVLGRYDDAEAQLHEALEIRQGALGDGHRSVGITASNLATAYYHRSRVDEAVSLQELAVRALQRSVGPDHQRSVVALGNLAVYRLVGGDWDAAVTDYRELLARQTRIQGRNHPVTITVMTSLATALAYQAGGSGNDSGFAEAEGLLHEALAIREATLGAAHPEVAGVLDALGNILSTRGKVREALAAQQRAVEIYRGTFGEVHARTAGALYRLATIRWTLNDVEGALRTGRSALRTYDATLGPTHVETVRARVSWCERLSYGRDIARETVDECAAAVAALATAPAGQQGQLTRARLWLAQAHLATGDVQAADSILAEVRAADTTSAAGSPERQALDSLTALIAERQ